MIEKEIDCSWSIKKRQEMFIANITKCYTIIGSTLKLIINIARKNIADIKE